MRFLMPVVLAGLVALAGCSSGGDTPTSPAPTSTSTTAAATSTAASTTGPLVSRFGGRLERQRQLVRCDSDPMGSICLQSVRNLGGTAQDLVQIAGAMGPEYTGVARVAQEVKGAADVWENCVQTAPESPERVACLPTIGTLKTGADSMLAAIHEVEQP